MSVSTSRHARVLRRAVIGRRPVGAVEPVPGPGSGARRERPVTTSLDTTELLVPEPLSTTRPEAHPALGSEPLSTTRPEAHPGPRTVTAAELLREHRRYAVLGDVLTGAAASALGLWLRFGTDPEPPYLLLPRSSRAVAGDGRQPAGLPPSALGSGLRVPDPGPGRPRPVPGHGGVSYSVRESCPRVPVATCR
jgi:hypothetical protein